MLTFTILNHDDLQAFADYDGHQTVVHAVDADTGLNAFIAVHNSHLGPALGGCRMFPYESEEAALKDALRLSRGMTYKNALAHLPLGGGKSVIIGNPFTDKTEALMQSFGAAVEKLGGLYITAEDSGTSEADMAAIRARTTHVLGLHVVGSDLGGNPSPVTAWGVYNGLRRVAALHFGSDTLAGRVVAVQGLGAVGYALCRLLHKDGVALVATDMRPDVLAMAAQEFPGLRIVAPDDIFDVPADIFAPCALGAVLNDDTIPRLRVKIVAGAANNQLAAARHDEMLAARGILYVPDYVLNAGGVIAVAYEHLQGTGQNPWGAPLTRASMMAHVARIGDTLAGVYEAARAQGTTLAHAADSLAETLFNPADDMPAPRTGSRG